MYIDDLNKMRDELLDRMVEDFKDAYIAAAVAETEGEDEPKIVRAILDEIGDDEGVIGEYYFTPIESEEDEVQFFNALITISEDVPEDPAALFEAMSYINFTIPAGSFAIDKDHNFISYRLSIPMSIDLGREAVYDAMNIAAGNSAAIADSYAGVLLDVVNKKLSVEEVEDLLGGRR